MAVEDDLLARLRKIEALMTGAGTVGEREAAGAALERVKARLAEQALGDPPVELQFSMPDAWSRPHSSPHSGQAIFGASKVAFATALANVSISGASLCSGMLGMRS